MNLQTEPVRLYALIAAALTSVGGALVAIGEGVDPLVAIGTALVSLAVVAGGGELGRKSAYSPATVDTVMDAEAVIAAAERGDHDG